MAIEKTEVKTIRFSKAEEKEIEKRAAKAGVAWGRYVREVALGTLPQDAADFSQYDQVKVLWALKNEINRAGNNLNQLARVANQTGAINSERLDDIRGELYRLKMEILNHLS